MREHDSRLWFPLAFLAAGSLPTVAVLVPARLAHAGATEQPPTWAGTR